MTPTYAEGPTLPGRAPGNIIALSTHPHFQPHFTTRFTARNHPGLDGPAADNSAPLEATLEFAREAEHRLQYAPIPVRLFVGPKAITRARAWNERHGLGSALAMPDGVDPAIVPWPPVALLVVVPENGRLPFPVAAGVATALRKRGVGYASIPHRPEWPNLWPARSPGDAA
jgi:hypothetical protein